MEAHTHYYLELHHNEKKKNSHFGLMHCYILIGTDTLVTQRMLPLVYMTTSTSSVVARLRRNSGGGTSSPLPNARVPSLSRCQFIKKCIDFTRPTTLLSAKHLPNRALQLQAAYVGHIVFERGVMQSCKSLAGFGSCDCNRCVSLSPAATPPPPLFGYIQTARPIAQSSARENKAEGTLGF